MSENKEATEANAAAIAPQEEVPAEASETDAESKIAALEAEKAKLLEEKENYKTAYLKETKKSKPSSENLEDEGEEEKMRRIAHEAMRDSRLAQIAQEQDALLKTALKENKELKLALKNQKPNVTSTAPSTESAPVTDTTITKDQLDYFKSKGWTDADINRYKKNLARNGR